MCWRRAWRNVLPYSHNFKCRLSDHYYIKHILFKADTGNQTNILPRDYRQDDTVVVDVSVFFGVIWGWRDIEPAPLSLPMSL